ncbi:uncharacterized protein BDZ83DRAFT_199633 [Colletotrichum acutatum]|uniref:Uncharacterized protein n=1 Tax=Glomerella acutata TaxID=27357 RepID=A0AAD8UA58_GLOAC|nr:uncharacterized protein BDZ83DRAFT_199633 [Colletotrichum acutatum]KAK1706091.1 hypothetical protein BDZ83DRAFT_199633 [Colletotrichum acutatum]
MEIVSKICVWRQLSKQEVGMANLAMPASTQTDGLTRNQSLDRPVEPASPIPDVIGFFKLGKISNNSFAKRLPILRRNWKHRHLNGYWLQLESF